MVLDAPPFKDTGRPYLGELSAATFSSLPPKMQAACRAMQKAGEIDIEEPGQPAAGREP